MGGSTDDPDMIALIQAQRIYSLTGHPVWPWELDEFPDTFLDAVRALTGDVEKKIVPKKKSEAKPRKG